MPSKNILSLDDILAISKKVKDMLLEMKRTKLKRVNHIYTLITSPAIVYYKEDEKEE